jgi:glycosyltransferase involved in cell wall biosynthesis
MKNKISFVIPYYNEQDDILILASDILSLKENSLKNIKEFLFVDDGSKDKTTKKLKKVLVKKKSVYDKCLFLENHKNIGFAKSLITGLNKASGNILVSIPSDGEVLLSEILYKITSRTDNIDVIFFERYNINIRPLNRIIISFFYRLIIALFFRTKFRDTNGIFAIRRKNLFNLNLESVSFFINAEILSKAIYMKLKIRFDNFKLNSKMTNKSSSLNFFQLFLVLKDFIKTFNFIYVRKKI